jgi:hypothetical protein
MLMGGHYLKRERFEGSQAMPASPSGGENRTEYTDRDRTSQETTYVCARGPNRLLLFGETVAVYCENHAEHTNTLCGVN